MSFELYTMPAAVRSLKKLPKPVKAFLFEELQTLRHNPHTGQPLRGKLKGYFSFHTKYQNTEYRVVYQVEAHQQAIIVYYAASRENFYKNLEQALFQ